MAAAYGCGFLGRPLTEEEQFGLELHIGRVRHKKAVEVLMGIKAAFGAGKLGREWFDAIATDEREVEELHWRVNADRQEAAMRAQLGFGVK